MNDRFDELARVWFEKAENDLNWAKDTLADNRFGGSLFPMSTGGRKNSQGILILSETKTDTHS